MKSVTLALSGCALLAFCVSAPAALVLDPSSSISSHARDTYWGHNNVSTDNSLSLPGSGSEVATQYSNGIQTTDNRMRATTNYTFSSTDFGHNFNIDWDHDPNSQGNVRSYGNIVFSIDRSYSYDLSGFYNFDGSGGIGSSITDFDVILTDTLNSSEVLNISLDGDGNDDLALSGAALTGILAAGDYSLYFFSRVRDTNGSNTLDRVGEVNFGVAAVNTPATALGMAIGLVGLGVRRKRGQEQSQAESSSV